MIYPVEIKKITSPYGNRTLPGRAPVFHFGTDFSGKNKFALAVCDMEIIYVVAPDEKFPCKFKWSDAKGMYIPDNSIPKNRAWTPYVLAISRLDHNVKFIYKHVNPLVEIGHIKEGEKIGEIGNFGFSMGPHLHFEVLVKGENVNPVDFLEGKING